MLLGVASGFTSGNYEERNITSAILLASHRRRPRATRPAFRSQQNFVFAGRANLAATAIAEV
jgi:hypothetical protein